MRDAWETRKTLSDLKKSGGKRRKGMSDIKNERMSDLKL